MPGQDLASGEAQQAKARQRHHTRCRLLRWQATGLARGREVGVADGTGRLADSQTISHTPLPVKSRHLALQGQRRTAEASLAWARGFGPAVPLQYGSRDTQGQAPVLVRASGLYRCRSGPSSDKSRG